MVSSCRRRSSRIRAAGRRSSAPPPACGRFAQTVEEQIANFEAAPRIREAFGDPLANAFVGVRRSDDAWAEGKSADEIVGVHLWRY